MPKQRAPLAPLMLDDSTRGVPPGTSGLPAAAVAEQNWRPAEGVMSLPVLTLDEAAFARNRDLMLAYAREQGVAIAPHAKTPMAPDLARMLVEAGAWGTTVADIRQASVMLRAGLTRLILANEVGGIGGASRLAALVAAWPAAELYVFADSVAVVDAIARAWRANKALPPLRVLVELGAARAGARTLSDAEAVLAALSRSDGRLLPAGVATYEGAAAQKTPEATKAVIDALLALTAATLGSVRKAVGPGVPLLVTAGGSGFFDQVVAALKPALERDGNAVLVLRSGAIFFHDHGVYDRNLAALDARAGFSLGGAPRAARSAFRPALRLWAEVLSRPEPGLAICGMGMRDVSSDQDLPLALRVHRDGRPLPGIPRAKTIRLNDQHAFLEIAPDGDIAVGDVIEFGISHPCTCLDRYRVIFGVGEDGRVLHAFPTFFG